MRRREFITLLGGAAASPFAARAQQLKVFRLGYLEPGSPSDPVEANLRRQFCSGSAISAMSRDAISKWKIAVPTVILTVSQRSLLSS
jgi:hypothetical protein